MLCRPCRVKSGRLLVESAALLQFAYCVGDEGGKADARVLSCWNRFGFVRLELRRLVDGYRAQLHGMRPPDGATAFAAGDPRPMDDLDFIKVRDPLFSTRLE